ncbi:MAG: transposase [Planctomycetota bacterium]
MWKPDGTVTKLRRAFNDTGHAHELTFCCYQRLPLLSKDRTREWFIEALEFARSRWTFELWAYVIMPEHVHVLLYPTSTHYDISLILKSIKLSVSRKAMHYLKKNAPHWLDKLKVVWPDGRIEHRFWQQGGGYDRNIYSEKVAWASINYIHENPVRRGLVDSKTDWRWSSARWYEGLDNVVLAMDGAP